METGICYVVRCINHTERFSSHLAKTYATNISKIEKLDGRNAESDGFDLTVDILLKANESQFSKAEASSSSIRHHKKEMSFN